MVVGERLRKVYQSSLTLWLAQMAGFSATGECKNTYPLVSKYGPVGLIVMQTALLMG
jgi:hypothetical protein